MNVWLARLRRWWSVQLHRPTSDHCQVELLESRQLLSGFSAPVRPLLPAPSLPEVLQRPLSEMAAPMNQLPGLKPALVAVDKQVSALPVLTLVDRLPPIVGQTSVAVQLGIAQDLQLGAALNIALGGTGTAHLQVQVGSAAVGEGILGLKGSVNTNLDNDQGPPVEATVAVRASGSPGLSLAGRVPSVVNLGPDPALSEDVAAQVELPGGPDLSLHGSISAGTNGGSGPGRNQDGNIHNTRSLVVVPAKTVEPIIEGFFAEPSRAGPNPADDRNSGGREEHESGGAASILVGGLGTPSIISSEGAVDAIFRSAGLGESDPEEILNVLALSPERLSHPPEVTAPEGAEDQAATVSNDQPPTWGIGEEWTVVDIPGDNQEGEGNLAESAPSGLVDYAAFDLASLERALQQFLAQVGQLDRELAQRGLYPWLVCLAATALVYEMTRRRAQRSAKAQALTTAAEEAFDPWRAGLAGLAPVA